MGLEIDQSKIRNSKQLTDLLKDAGLKINGAKELLYDDEDEIVGVVVRPGKPVIFTDKEYNTLKDYLDKEG